MVGALAGTPHLRITRAEASIPSSRIPDFVQHHQIRNDQKCEALIVLFLRDYLVSGIIIPPSVQSDRFHHYPQWHWVRTRTCASTAMTVST